VWGHTVPGLATITRRRASWSKRAIIVSVTAGVVLGSFVAAAPARAASTSTQVDQITCEALLAMQPDEQQRMASWVNGDQTTTGDAAVGVVAFDTLGKPRTGGAHRGQLLQSGIPFAY